MSARKRAAGNAASPELDTPDPIKKRKKNEDTHYPDEETATTTTDIGLKLVKQLRNSKDKTGRNVAGHFIQLPDKDEYPEYYDQVKMPISLDMVEAKLEDHAYPTMEALESDLKRLVQNAKEFNSTKSEVYEDAERIRKALSNFMPKHNPAYLDPAYRAYPTPIPRDAFNKQNALPVEISENLKIVIPNLMGKRRKSTAAPAGEDDGPDDDLVSRQVALIDEMMEQPNSENFYDKPSKRQYPQYYKQISHPTALTDIRRMAEKGHLQTWAAFIEEVRFIWDNAKDFNEEGSQIYKFAEALESWFENQMTTMGLGPRKLKLNVRAPPNITLRVNTPASTPGPAGGSIDNDSLRRQREETGQALVRAQSTDKKTGMTPVPSLEAHAAQSMSAVATPAAVDDANVDQSMKVAGLIAQLSDAQQPLNSQSLSNATMQPPQLGTGLPISGSHYGGSINLAPPVVPKAPFERDSPFDRVMRDSGKGLQDSLLSGVTIMTCPRMPNDPKWKVTRQASDTMTQTAGYVYLPSNHYYLRVVPHLTDELKSRNKHKLVVCRNWETLYPQQDLPGVYDFRIHPGENNIIVDVVAELKEGESKSYAPPQLQLDFERIQYIVMLRDPTPE